MEQRTQTPPDVNPAEVRRLHGHLVTVEVGPLDVIVVTVPHILTAKARAHMIMRVKAALGVENRILILDSGLQLGVLNPTKGRR